MLTGPLPVTTNFTTWTENIEVRDVSDESLVDLSDADEITLTVRDPRSMVDEITLTMTGGDITVPQDGVVQWRAEATAMAVLEAKTYMVIMTMEDEDDTVLLIYGTISILE